MSEAGPSTQGSAPAPDAPPDGPAPAGTAVCVVHPKQPAFVTCRRCGSYACEYCLGAGDLCAACRDREEGGGVIAWERRDLGAFRRFTQTVRQVLAHTGRTFTELRPGSVPAALGYAALVFALTSLFTLFLLAPCMLLSFLGWMTPLQVADPASVAPVFVMALCGGPILQAVDGVLSAIALGLVFHGAAKLLGGRAGLDTSVRAAAYGLTVVLVWAPFTIALLLPTIGLIVLSLLFLGQLVWGASLLTTVAREHHGLTGARAAIAGWTPAVLTLLLVGITAGGIWLARDVTEPSHAPDVYYSEPGY